MIRSSNSKRKDIVAGQACGLAPLIPDRRHHRDPCHQGGDNRLGISRPGLRIEREAAQRHADDIHALLDRPVNPCQDLRIGSNSPLFPVQHKGGRHLGVRGNPDPLTAGIASYEGPGTVGSMLIRITGFGIGNFLPVEIKLRPSLSLSFRSRCSGSTPVSNNPIVIP